MTPLWALTGTPGTGKSVVATVLAEGKHPIPSIEVSDLAISRGAGTRSNRTSRPTVVVDLPRLCRSLARRPLTPSRGPTFLLVGHLSHLLPVQGIILLRCHPSELNRRLRSRGDPPPQRHANVESERVDVVLVEAASRRLPLYEIDTSGRTPAQVARSVRLALAGQLRLGGGKVDWLRDAPPRPEERERGSRSR